MRILLALALSLVSLPAVACEIDGDSIAVGLAVLMPEGRHSAENGITSAAVADRVQGSDFVIASAGSNDRNPLEMTPPSLDLILERSRGRLLLIMPANKSRRVVAKWAARHGVRTVSFTPGADGSTRATTAGWP